MSNSLSLCSLKHSFINYRKVEEVFAGKPSGIFNNAVFQPNDSIPKLTVWENYAQKELELIVTHPPANGFEKMIHWTKQGKLWHFPIDNEQGTHYF